MARLKKSNSHYEGAITRLASLKSIAPTLDLGNGMTVITYETAIADLRLKLDTYNTALSQVDSQLNSVQEYSATTRDRIERCKGRTKKILPAGRREARPTDGGWRFFLERA